MPVAVANVFGVRLETQTNDQNAPDIKELESSENNSSGFRQVLNSVEGGKQVTQSAETDSTAVENIPDSSGEKLPPMVAGKTPEFESSSSMLSDDLADEANEQPLLVRLMATAGKSDVPSEFMVTSQQGVDVDEVDGIGAEVTEAEIAEADSIFAKLSNVSGDDPLFSDLDQLISELDPEALEKLAAVVEKFNTLLRDSDVNADQADEISTLLNQLDTLLPESVALDEWNEASGVERNSLLALLDNGEPITLADLLSQFVDDRPQVNASAELPQQTFAGAISNTELTQLESTENLQQPLVSSLKDLFPVSPLTKAVQQTNSSSVLPLPLGVNESVMSAAAQDDKAPSILPQLLSALTADASSDLTNTPGLLTNSASLLPGNGVQSFATGLALAEPTANEESLVSERIALASLLTPENSAADETLMRALPALEAGESLHQIARHRPALEQQLVTQALIQRPLQATQLQAGDEVSARVQMMLAANIQHANIRLDPPELGSLEIRIQVQNDQTQIQIVTQSPQVREALESQSVRLREALNEQGLNLANLDVSDQSAQQQGDQPSGQGQSGGAGAAEADVEETATVATAATVGLVDHYV